MEIKIILEEILKKMKKEQDRINDKLKSGWYSTNECRDEFAEVQRCIDIVIGVAEQNFDKGDVRKMVKKCL